MNVQRDWSEVGRRFYDYIDGKIPPMNKTDILQAIDELDWKPVPDSQRLKLPGNDAIALITFVKAMKLPKLSDIAISYKLKPYTLYAIRTHYNNGQVELYVINDGIQCTILCTDLHPMELDKEGLIKSWIELGKSTVPEMNRMFFYECVSLEILELKLQERDYRVGQAFFYKNICWINIQDSDAIWRVIRDGIEFQKWAWPTPEQRMMLREEFNFQDSITKVLALDVTALRALKSINNV